MKYINKIFCLGAVAIAVTAASSCKKDNKGTAAGGSDSVLAYIGNNIILPAYQSTSSDVVAMDAAVLDFNASPDAAKLTALQTLFKKAYTDWQSISEYNSIGPAMTIQPGLKGLNLFPVSADKINSNISSGNYDISSFTNAAAKGFPAMDYLLFNGSDVLSAYTTDALAENRKKYLAAVSADIRSEITAVATAWLPSGGNYIKTFNSATGNSISGSLGLLINSLDEDFEILKNDRLGIPLGKLPPGSSLPVMPNEVEAYYSGISVQLALAQLKTAEQIYLKGLDPYVVKINARYNGGALSDTIKAHFTAAITQLNTIPDPLSQAIQSNPAPANAVFAETQELVVLLKTDMPSALGILITYGDNDGD